MAAAHDSYQAADANVAMGLAVAPPSPSSQSDDSGGGGGGFTANSSLYVGDLDASVNEAQLYDVFSQVAEVVSIRVCKDQTKQSSLAYAYVNFNTQRDAANAMEILNFTPINGKPLRIMFSHRDPTVRKSGRANVFIKNLDASIDNKALYDIFAAFGTILSCKVALDSNGKSKGYGFVQFDEDESAKSAINRLNGRRINDKQVHVGLFVRQQDRNRTNGEQKFTNIYVKNLPKTITVEDLQKVFGKYGYITSAVVMKDANGKSRCFGFINFQTPEDAAAAVENMNGTSLADKVLYVGKALRKADREAVLKTKFEQERTNRFEKLQGANLYIKNLEDNITDEKLRELFSPYGTITSCKVLVNSQGMSKGSGFVAFSSTEEATRALNEMNGKTIGRKPLYVAVAQRKDERMARLQAYFAQVRVGGIATLPAAGIPGYNPRAPRLAPPHVYFGQSAPGLIRAHGYGFHQPFLPGVRPGVPPNFIMPYPLQRQGQPGQRLNGIRGGNPQQQQQQLIQWNSAQGLSRYMGNGKNAADASIVLPQGVIGSMTPFPFDASRIPINSLDIRNPGPVPVSALANTLASVFPYNQRLTLGEHLFHLVEQLEAENAGKITGMLLEMDQIEVLHLIESPDALQKKVAEAMGVLRLASSGSDVAAKRLGSLSLNE